MSTFLNSILFIVLVFLTKSAVGQNPDPASDLNKLIKIEVGYAALGLGYEMPLDSDFTAELSSGISFGYQVDPSPFGIDLLFPQLVPVFYLKSELKYYYDQHTDIYKLNPIIRNEGSYFAFQSKYTSKGVRNEVYASPTILNEIHWGNQKAFLGNFLFNPHFGLGYAWDFSVNDGAPYFAMGLKLSYTLLSRNR